MKDHMGFEDGAAAPHTVKLPDLRAKRAPKIIARDKKGNPLPPPPAPMYWNVLTHAWQRKPAPSRRIASADDGTPLTFAVRPDSREEVHHEPPARPLTVVEIARLHGEETMRKHRGANGR